MLRYRRTATERKVSLIGRRLNISASYYVRKEIVLFFFKEHKKISKYCLSLSVIIVLIVIAGIDFEPAVFQCFVNLTGGILSLQGWETLSSQL